MGKPWRDRFGSVRGGPVRQQRRDKETTKEDERTGRQTGRGGGWGKGELRGGNVPSRRISPCTLLSYEGGFHSRWPQRRGEGFFFSLHPPEKERAGTATPDGPKWTAQRDEWWVLRGSYELGGGLGGGQEG